MSLSDYEIMGGIGYGGDGVSMNTMADIKSLILSEQPFPTRVPRKMPQPFAAGAGLGRPQFQDPWIPPNQEPMGRSYRPDRFGSSPGTNSGTYYQYPPWNPNDPISGIAYEPDSIAGSNSLAVENYFQTETARFGNNESVNRVMPPDGRANAYDLWSLGGIKAVKEHLTDGLAEATQIASNNYNILIIMLFIVFIVVAYLQHRQIQKLQKIIGRVVAPKPTV